MFSLHCAAVLAAAITLSIEAHGSPQDPPRAAAATGTIAGRISDGDSGSPLARARVILTSPALSASRVTITAGDGVYRFDALPPGGYVVRATRSGYVGGAYGERRLSGPVPLSIGQGQQAVGIDLALAPAGVIAGQILDEDNKPFAGAIVQALVARTVDSQAELVPVASTTSDDRGEFRLIGLRAGEYHVSAFDPAFEHAGDESGALRYTPTYYPGVAMADRATHVTVRAGVEPGPKIVFPLKIVSPVRVSGRLATADRRPLVSGGLVLAPIQNERVVSVPAEGAQMMPDGRFTFRNVPPGRYEIRAHAEVASGSVPRFATFRLVVEGRNIDSVEMVLTPGASLEGRLIVEATAPGKRPAFAGVRVRAPLPDGRTFADTPTGKVNADGSFHIRGMMTGTHLVVVDGLQEPWIVKRVEHRGEDITDAGLRAESRQQFTDVRVTITDVANEISGTVRDAAGNLAPEATVVILPLAEQFWVPASRRFGITRSAGDGRYRIRGLPAGEYRAAATVEFDEAELSAHERLRQLADSGSPLTLAPLETRTLDLTLTSTAALRRSTSR